MKRQALALAVPFVAFLLAVPPGGVASEAAVAPAMSNTASASDTLQTGQGIGAGLRLRSARGAYVAVMQGDGNLVVYAGSRVLWHAGTHGNPGARLVVQHDGNLVVYSWDDRALWHSRTHGQGPARLVMQDDGNLVVYRADNRPLWNTGPDRSPVPPPEPEPPRGPTSYPPEIIHAPFIGGSYRLKPHRHDGKPLDNWPYSFITFRAYTHCPHRGYFAVDAEIVQGDVRGATRHPSFSQDPLFSGGGWHFCRHEGWGGASFNVGALDGALFAPGEAVAIVRVYEFDGDTVSPPLKDEDRTLVAESEPTPIKIPPLICIGVWCDPVFDREPVYGGFFVDDPAVVPAATRRLQELVRADREQFAAPTPTS